MSWYIRVFAGTISVYLSCLGVCHSQQCFHYGLSFGLVTSQPEFVAYHKHDIIKDM